MVNVLIIQQKIVLFVIVFKIILDHHVKLINDHVIQIDYNV